MAEEAQTEVGGISLLESIASLLGRPVSEIDTDTIHELVQIVTKKGKQCQLLEGRVGLLQAQLVRAEQASSELEQSLSQKDTQNAELSQLKSSFAQVSEEYKKAVNLNDTLRNEFEGLQFQIKNIEAKAEQLNTQKLTLIEALEEKQKQIEQLNIQLHETRRSSMLNRDDQISKDQTIIQKNKEITHLNLSLNSLKSQLESAKSAEQWSQQEINRLNSELSSLKMGRIEEASSLRASLSKLQASHDEAMFKLKRLYEDEESKSRKLMDLQDACGKLQIQLKEQEAAFSEELASNVRLAELYKGNCEELTQKLEEITGMSDENMMSQESMHSSLRNELQSVVHENQTLKHRIQELDSFVQTYTVSPTAASMSNSHFAVEYQHLQNELTILRIENDRLKASLQEICRDVDDQVQVLQKEKRDNERLRSELSSISQQILSVCQQNERLLEDIRDTKAVNKQLEIKNSSLFSQISEFKSVLSGMDNKSAFDRSSAAIESLQRRNEELCEKIAELEECAGGSPSSVQKQLSEALDQISKMKEQRDRQNSLLEALSKKENVSSVGNGAVSKEEHQRAISNYQNQISELQTRNNQLAVSIAKLEANLQLSHERLQHSQNSSDFQRSELERAKAQFDCVYNSLNDAQKQLQNVSIELIKSRDAERSEAAKAQKALIEASIAKESESRLQSALAECNADKNRLLNVLNGLKSALVENEQSFERYRDSTTRTIESLQAKLQESNPRLESIQSELANLNAENQQLKQRLQEQARSMDSLLEARLKMATEGDYQSLKSTLEQYQVMQRSSEDAYNQLLTSFNNLKEAKDAEIQQLHVSLTKTEAEMQEHFKTMNELTTEKLSLEAKLHVVEGEGNQSLLKNLETSLNQTRSQLEKELDENKMISEKLQSISTAYQELQGKFGELENAYANVNMRLQMKDEEYQVELQKWQESKATFENRIQELAQQNSGFFSQIEELLKARSSGIIDEAAAENYDDRLGQVISILRQQKDSLQMEHEKNSQELRMTKLRLEQTQRSLDEARATMEHSKQNDFEKLERDYNLLKEKFEQLLALRNSNQTLRSENTRLLSQVTTLEQELASVRESIEPLNSQLREVRAELSGKVRLVEQLQKRPAVEDQSQKVTELETTKAQLEQRISDLDGRHKRLMTALNNLRNENANLKESQEQLKTAEQERDNLVKEYEMKNSLLTQKCELLKSQLEKAKAVPAIVTAPALQNVSTPITEDDEDEEEFEEDEAHEDFVLFSACEEDTEEEESHEEEGDDHLVAEPEVIEESKVEPTLEPSVVHTPQKEDPPSKVLSEETPKEKRLFEQEEKPVETTRKRGVIDLSMLKKAASATPVAPKPTAPPTSNAVASSTSVRRSSGSKNTKRKRSKKDK